MSSRRQRQHALATAITVAAVLIAGAALARPGGGSSYHGSSHSSGGGGGDWGGGGGGGGTIGDILAVIDLVIFCVEHPIFTLVVALVIAVLYFVGHKTESGRRDWSTTTASPRAAPERPPPPVVEDARRDLDGLQRHDATFSAIVFEDFLYGLYAQVHAARGAGKLGTFSAYLGPQALASLAAGKHGNQAPKLSEVKTIIVGALHFTSAVVTRDEPPLFLVTIEIEANYTEATAKGRERAWYVRERWKLSRSAAAKSRTPDRARIFACPSCGAPLDGVAAARCRHCGKDVCNGEFDWVVTAIDVLEREARGPMLTEMAPEEGTNEPTVVDSNARDNWAALTRRDPSLTWQGFEARVTTVFFAFQRAWAARDLAAMRPFFSDSLFEVETYWVRAYEAQKLHNVTQNARITRVELARVSTDAFFDAVTLRLFATSLDYTVRDGDGHLVCGSRTKERSYSEYWTFLRSAKRAGPPRTDNVCPNCGAPLSVSMAGHCTYCQAKVTSGDFDWVLSRIEQDESYQG